MSTKINKLIHKLLIANVILLIISYSLILFLVIMINKNIFFLLAYPLFGLLITLIILYWGVFAKKEIILNKKQKRFYSIVWWINLLYNHGPFITYNDQPFEGKKKGWYSANAMGLLLIETFLFLTIVFNFINLDHNIVFNFTNFDLNMLLVCFWIISYILLLINYGLSIAWEITDANTRGEGFPHNKIITPIISVIVLVTSIYILFRIFR